ncbi:Methyladenine glycosylase [Corchorus olitorius]|uniref:Methyladenine glycosylase n=1 Tax=Corchorus olitorius TaxID=93759 RepID=A0A1R3HNZ3_9ROSI|nr:Methyladenine glycosylase [Corchorus olitorius]
MGNQFPSPARKSWALFPGISAIIRIIAWHVTTDPAASFIEASLSITDKLYISFHDEQWGVPVYYDNQLFELPALSGLLMDYNWTEILKRKELYREAFSGFDPEIAAKMGDKEINEISSNKAIMLAEIRIVREYGSFSSFMWGYVNYKPTINKYKYPRNVPFRTPKAEAVSRDLLKRGF